MLETRTRFPGQIDQPEPPEQMPPLTRQGISTAAHLRASLRMYQACRGREGATAGSRLAAALPIVRGDGNEGEDMSDLNGKVALVSGAARGIGAAIAQTMVDHGAKVVIGDVLDGEGQALAEKIGPPATYVHLDVTSPDEWTAAVARRSTGTASSTCS
jgi:NADPH:quinone reductase-like Zn-dependent oxidoreductase